jgi:hypothetical protein
VESVSILDTNLLAEKENSSLIAILKSFRENESILIVDDVSTTGARLKNYSKKLRECFKGQIHYLVGVARPDHDEKWNKRVKDLKFRPRIDNQVKIDQHVVSFIEKLILPDWDERTCPWCKELKIVDEIITKPRNKDYPLTKSLKRRHYILTNGTEAGLTNDAFYSINKNVKPGFQGKSIFAESSEISEADLIAAVSAALQFLRNTGVVEPETEIINKLELDYPHLKILNIDNYIGEAATYDEALVKAAIFRCTDRHELHATTESSMLKQKEGLLRFFDGKDLKKEEVCFFIYELFLALKAGKFPKPDIDKKLLKILEEAFNKK